MKRDDNESSQEYLSFFDGKKVSVTGASGFMGSSLLRALGQSACEVSSFGRRRPNFPEKGKASFEHHLVDFSESTAWVSKAVQADVVFHLAAQTSSVASNENPSADAAVNLYPALKLFEAASSQLNPPRIIVAGTVTQRFIGEGGGTSRASFYDVHKLLTELVTAQYSAVTNIHAVSLRFSNVYGPGPNESASDRGVLNKMIRLAIQGKPLPLFRPGTFRRDYLFVRDAVDAMCLASVHAHVLGGPSYEVSSGNSRPISDAFEEVARLANKRTGRDAHIELVEAPGLLGAVDTRDFWSNAEAFRKKTGWLPRHDFVSGVLETIDDVLANS